MTLYIGSKAPQAITAVVTAGTSGVDLSTVTDADLIIYKPGGVGFDVWPCDLSQQSPTSVLLTHVFDALGVELDVDGVYIAVPRLVLPGGSLLTFRDTFRVLDPASR